MIFIHIGLRKAGSASLQVFLSANATALEGMGWLYPRAGRLNRFAHHNLFNELRDRRNFVPRFGRLADVASEWRDSEAGQRSPEERTRLGPAAMRVGEAIGWNADPGAYLTLEQASLCVAAHRRAVEALNRRPIDKLALPPDLEARGFGAREGPPPSAEQIPAADLRLFYDALDEASASEYAAAERTLAAASSS